MRHFSCDLCGKDLTARPDARYVLRMEVAPVAAALCEADLDQDHLDAMAEMLDDLEAERDAGLEPRRAAAATQRLEFDLCPGCRQRFVADPLGRERVPKPRFSPN